MPLGRLSPSTTVYASGGAVGSASFKAASPALMRPTTMIAIPIQRAPLELTTRRRGRSAGAGGSAISSFGAIGGAAAVASRVAAHAATWERVVKPSLLQI